MKNIYLLGLFLLGSVLSYGQTCPPTDIPLRLTIPQPAFCNEDQVSFSTNVDAVNYFWHPGQGSTFATTIPSFSFTYTNAGKYEVLLVVDYGNDCRDSTTMEVEIIASSVDFDFTIDSLTVSFDADTSQYIDTYFWDFGNQLTGSGASVITRYPTFGEYPVTLYTEGICPPDSSTQLIILPPTTNDTETNCEDGLDNDGDGTIDCLDSDCGCDCDTGAPLEITKTFATNANCSNHPISFTSSRTAESYSWNYGDGIINQGNTTFPDGTPTGKADHIYSETGIYQITLIVDYGQMCMDTAFYDVEVITSDVDFTFEVNENIVIFQADTSENVTDYNWQFSGSGLDGKTGVRIEQAFSSVGTFQVTLMTSGACISTPVSKMVTIEFVGTENTPSACGDGLDNDGDGVIDCKDSDCACDMDMDGTIATNDPDDNNPCVPNSDVEVCQNNSNPQIFEDFPFLSDLVDPNNCTSEKISVYKSGSFFFILVETVLNTKLYFQTGQFYCEMTSNYNCVEAYNLGAPISIWTCENPNFVDNDQDGILSDVDPDDNDPCVPNESVSVCIQDKDGDGTFSDTDPDDNDPCVPNESVSVCIQDKDGDGAFSDIDPDDNDPCVPNESISVCIQDKDGDGIFSDTDPDDNNPCVPDNTVANCDTTVIMIPELFNDFPWLTDLVDPTNCSNEQITVYQSGAFNFIYVESGESSILYFETGLFYCQSAPNFDCVAAYNLSNPIATWTCNPIIVVDADNDGTPASTDPDDMNPCVPDDTVSLCIQDKDEDGTFSDTDPDDNNPCVPDNTVSNCDTTVSSIPNFFNDFPWLSDLVDPTNCTDEKISIYQSGIFNFIYIESDNVGTLYFETGSFYCQSAANFDCVSVYGLSNPTVVWSCSNPNIADADMDGVFSDDDPDDNDPCVPNERADNCISDQDNDGVFSDVDPDDNNPCIPNNTASTCDTTAIPLPELFEEYPFLYDLFDPLNCTDEVVKVYDLGPYAFLFVENSEGGNLYYETGAFYCKSAPNYDCVAAYNLGEPTAIWECMKDTVVVTPPVIPNCTKNTGTIVFLDCNEQQFFMIETNEGELLDIYFADGIEFNYFEGQSVNYDFVAADFNSPCDMADKAVTITCIEEIRDSGGGPALFEEYTFLYNLIDPNNCTAAEKVTVYTSGAFNYLFVESAIESALYFQDGSFFCLQASNYDCVAAYGFNESNITASWTCEQTTFTPAISGKHSLPTTPVNKIAEKVFSFKAAPNPAQNHLWVNINSPKAQTLQLKLMNRTGQTLITSPLTISKGQVRIPFSLEEVGNGMYYLLLLNKETGDSQMEKIVVLKK